MVEKTFSFKNYLEPIDLEDPQMETFFEEDENIDENDVIYGYPFTKEQLISYLKTEEFLSSIGYKKDEASPTPLNLKQIFESIPLERKLEEIQAEKRRRYQAYKALEYNLSSLTYFDFFSFDSFEIVKNAKFLAQIYEKKEVTPELLLLPFFDTTLEIGKVLKEVGFDETFVQSFSTDLQKVIGKGTNQTEEGGIKKKIISFIKKTSNQVEEFVSEYFAFDSKSEVIFNQKIKYSYETHQIFEKAAENGLSRFKTPVITPEILFITLMEEKDSKVGKKIRKILNDETTWYLIRYKLLKRLYHQEINVRNQVSKNQQFFAYLLKTELPESSFEKLIKKKLLSKSVALFRNLIIRDIMKKDLFDSFDIETHSAILISPKRFYSS